MKTSYIYIPLIIVSLLVPFYVFKAVELNDGFNVKEFIQSTWIQNFYAKSVTIDFWVTASTASIFILIEGIRLKMKYLWIYILSIFLIAIAFVFPLFLFFRHRKIHSCSLN